MKNDTLISFLVIHFPWLASDEPVSGADVVDTLQSLYQNALREKTESQASLQSVIESLSQKDLDRATNWLYTAVHQTASEQASAINNAGILNQLNFLDDDPEIQLDLLLEALEREEHEGDEDKDEDEDEDPIR